MKRSVMAVVFVGVLAGVALWQFPGRRGDAALAAVARAMANVTSAHFVGWNLDQATGEQRRMEAWVKGTSKLRLVREGASDFDIADNGKMTVTMRDSNGVRKAVIEAPRRALGSKRGMPYLDMFAGGEGLTSMLESNGYMVETVSSGTLPTGGAATVIQLRHIEGGKAVLVVDANSNLLAQWKAYDRNGTLLVNVDSIEYNTEIADSTFEITIPEGTPMLDYLTPPSRHVLAAHEQEEARLRAAGGEALGNPPTGMWESPYHDGLYFQNLNKNGMIVFFFRERNTYYVVGRALVIAGHGAFHQVVENAEIPAPGKPDFSRAHAPRPVNPRVEAAEKEIRSLGGEVILKLREGAGDSCGSPYHPKLNFQVLRDDGCVIGYMPDRNAYRIFGKVRVFGMGLDRVVENGEIQAPGPPETPEK